MDALDLVSDTTAYPFWLGRNGRSWKHEKACSDIHQDSSPIREAGRNAKNIELTARPSNVLRHPDVLIVDEPDRGVVQPGAGQGPASRDVLIETATGAEWLESIEPVNEEEKLSGGPNPPKPSSVHPITGRDTGWETCLPHPRRAAALERPVRPNQQEPT